jgi:sugar lactone lactonase YvrE
VTSSRTEVVAEGLAFGEGPRWHDGALWFSDIHALWVKRFDTTTGAIDDIVHVPGRPSGLGWDRDGALVIVSMHDRRLLRWNVGGPDDLSEVADLSGYTPYPINDMVVSERGHAYIGGYGFDFDHGAAPATTVVLRVNTVTGAHEVAADGTAFPNGMAITADGHTLIVGESMAALLTAFTIGDDGALRDRRLWAALQPAFPDGICLDADGCVWVASPGTRECLRVREGGEIVERVSTGDRLAIACALGGDDRRTLFICTAIGLNPKKAVELRTARIEAVRVDVGGAGLP